MHTYQSPLSDIQFLLYDVFNLEQKLAELDGIAETDRELLGDIVTEMARFTEQVFLPCNQSGDQEGCSYHQEDKRVSVPPSYQAPFRHFVESGWTSLTAPREYGGQGLPLILGTILDEMCSATNPSLGMYFGLSHGAMVALEKHASDELKERYLGKLISGVYTGTMCLTEAHCGTDLGLIRTRATSQPDGHYLLSGSKIWISGGEQDLSENIVHLVLAKIKDAPEGTKGISLFLVPKVLPDGSRNPIFCTGLEHKMGINGSATCFMSLENATGYLIGEPHKGLSYMFSMMNSARLMVGLQGLGLGEAAYQTALTFARERTQGRSPAGTKNPTQEADGILVHPDVRRMLLRQKSMLEGCRALAYWVAIELDVSEYHQDVERRKQAREFVELMTPVVKAFVTDQGYLVCDQAMQTLGGSGYTQDWSIEQLLRDCRISRIYEGTNGIQALDFVGRKLPMSGGAAVRRVIGEIMTFANEQKDESIKRALLDATNKLTDALMWLSQEGAKDREQAAAAATPLLSLFGYVCLAYLLARSAATAEHLREDNPAPFVKAKSKTLQVFLAEHLPQVDALLVSIKQGKQHLMAFDEEEF